jgi:hypothetical protein
MSNRELHQCHEVFILLRLFAWIIPNFNHIYNMHILCSRLLQFCRIIFVCCLWSWKLFFFCWVFCMFSLLFWKLLVAPRLFCVQNVRARSVSSGKWGNCLHFLSCWKFSIICWTIVLFCMYSRTLQWH